MNEPMGSLAEAAPTHTDEPVIVAQMGKVGSTSVTKALAPLGIPVYQVHHLDRAHLDSVAEVLRAAGQDQEHIRHSYHVLTHIVGQSMPAKVISLVRDPVARNLSAFIQNKDVLAQDARGVEDLIRTFLGTYAHEVPAEYFDLHIRPVFGIDVFATPFDHERKRLLAASGPYSLLVLRAEDPDEIKQAALRELLGRDDIAVARANVAANKKKYSSVYAEFLSRIHLPGDYVDRLLSSKMARHFYTPEELAAFGERWRRPAVMRPVEVLAPEKDLPTIALVSPSFNQAGFVGRMLESVRAQSLAPAEHIILDSCSTDGTTDLLRAYASGSDRATLIVEKDNGQVDAINRGFAQASADVVAWLNTDDVYTDPDALRAVASVFAREPDVDVVYARGRFVDPEGRPIRDAFINADPDALEREFTHSVGILQPALFFRRNVIERFGPLDESMHFAFDYEYWIRLARRGAKFRFLDRTIVDATLHPSSKTQAQRARQYHESLVAVRRHYGFVPLRWLRRLAEYEVSGIDGIVRGKNDVPHADLARIDERLGELQREWNGSPEALRRLLQRPASGPGAAPINETVADLVRRGIVDTDRTVVTSFTSAYFQQGLNLIASLHRLGPGACPLILVYDIDLTPAQRAQLNDIERVAVRDYPAEVSKFFDGYMSPKNYAYKCAAIRAAGEVVRPGDRVLWIDAGVAAVRGIDEIFDLVRRDGAFFVDHDDKPGWPFINATFTHPEAARRMLATGRELLAPHLCSCLIGYVKGGPAQPLIDEAYRHSQDPKIVAWTKHLEPSEQRPLGSLTPQQRSTLKALQERAEAGKDVDAEKLLAVTPYLGHRQDQSIYSILCARYGFPQHSARRFCWSGSESSRASMANWKSGAEAQLRRSGALPPEMPASALTYHHRGLFSDLSGLALADRAETCVLLGNGPSLRGFDFARLAGADSIGMNAAYRFWDRIRWYPTHYCCMDKVVIMSHAEEILRLICERKSNGIRRFFLRAILADAHPEIREDPSVVILEDVRDAFPALQVKDITTGNFSALFAATLGYKKVALLGIDVNYVEQIDTAKPAGATRLVIEETPRANPNYFFDDYQQKGDLYNIPNVTPGFHAGSWVETERVLTAMGVTVLNCNDQSKLTVFPFASLEETIHAEAAAPATSRPALVAAEYARDAGARIEELDFVRAAIGSSRPGDQMVDVGAHHGGSCVEFLRAGWNVLAFEPDPANRERLTKRLGKNARLTIDPRAVGDAPRKGVPFFASGQSTGASSLAAFTEAHNEAASVDVTTLTLALAEHRVSDVRLLKIDAEGFDKHVLEGFPWDKTTPAVVMCEFEDRKTTPLGYTCADMAALLESKGYAVYASEWHPIVRYGIRHDWRRLFRWNTGLAPAEQSWGNLVAFRYSADAEVFESLVRGAIVSGSLTRSGEPEDSHQPGSVAETSAATESADPAEPLTPRPAETPRTHAPASRILGVGTHAPVRTPPAALPKQPFVRVKLPWAPRRPELHTRAERVKLMVGKLARIYWGRTGLLAGLALALWIAGVVLLTLGQPLWMGLSLMTAAWGPVLVLIALLAVTARRQAFENDAALRGAVERGIREAVKHARGS